jgi:hypothetical protein
MKRPRMQISVDPTDANRLAEGDIVAYPAPCRVIAVSSDRYVTLEPCPWHVRASIGLRAAWGAFTLWLLAYGARRGRAPQYSLQVKRQRANRFSRWMNGLAGFLIRSIG